MQIRVLEPRERHLAAGLWQYCFADPPQFTDWYFARRAGDILAAMDGEAVAAQMVCVPMTLGVRGAARSAMMLSGVATAPEYRRQGHMSGLMREGLAYLREKGAAYAALYPFDYGFYRQYGFASCCEVAKVKAPMSAFPSGKYRGAFTVTSATRADCAALARAYEASYGGYSGHAIRDEEAFAQRLEELALEGGYAAIYRREGKEEGYLLYHMSDKVLEALEIAASTDIARQDTLAFLGSHASSMDAASFMCPLEDPLWRMLPDPRGRVSAEPHSMLRVVDIPGAMRGLPAGKGDVTLNVRDTYAPWNQGAWRFYAKDDVLEVERAQAPEAPVVSIEALTQWALGSIDCREELLPRQRVFLQEMY